MPLFQAMSERANQLLGRDSIGGVAAELINPQQNLVEAATALGIAKTMDEKNYLSSWPGAVQQAIVSSVHSAIVRGVPITMSWAPGPDFELQLWEAHGVASSPGGITMLLRSPYPVLGAAKKRTRRRS
jgi:hypothetical protein